MMKLRSMDRGSPTSSSSSSTTKSSGSPQETEGQPCAKFPRRSDRLNKKSESSTSSSFTPCFFNSTETSDFRPSPEAETICLDSEDDSSRSVDVENNYSHNLILEFPLKSSTMGSVEIYLEDVKCLGATRYLNDKIIDFGMNLVWEKVAVKDQQKSFLFSSLFYNSLCMKQGRSRCRGPPSRWTKGITDIFKKKFIFIPISQQAHWVLVVICNPGLLKNISKMSRMNNLNNRPMIVIFDSFKDLGISYKKIAKKIRKFLTFEWQKTTHQSTSPFTEENIPILIPSVLQQDNSYDCGIYLLQYFESFFSDPITFYSLPSLQELDMWFNKKKVEEKREEILQAIVDILKDSFPERLSLLTPTTFSLSPEEEEFPPVSDFLKNFPGTPELFRSDDEEIMDISCVSIRPSRNNSLNFQRPSPPSPINLELRTSILKDWDCSPKSCNGCVSCLSDADDEYVPLPLVPLSTTNNSRNESATGESSFLSDSDTRELP